MTYDNECIAYFEEQNGNFLERNCRNFVESNDQIFQCSRFDSQANSNFFERYNCSNEDFGGNELYLQYMPTGNPNKIAFMTNAADLKLFLVRIDEDDLECLATSEDNCLEHDALGAGDYYIIADRIQSSNFFVNFCDPITSVSDTDFTEDVIVYPNPARDILNIESPSKSISEVTMYSSLGQNVWHKNVSGQSTSIISSDINGVHLVRILYSDHTQEVVKVIFEE